MNIGESFSVDCMKVTDPSSGAELLFMRFTDYIALAIGDSFVKLTYNHLYSDLQALRFHLIAEGLFGPDAEFAATVLAALAEHFSPSAVTGIETKP